MIWWEVYRFRVFFEVKIIVFVYSLDVNYKKKWSIEDDYVFGLINWNNEVVINWVGVY